MSNNKTLSDAKIKGLAKMLKALSSPHRLRFFLGALARSEGKPVTVDRAQMQSCQRDLAKKYGLAPSTVSHHFKELEHAGLLESKRDGQRIRWWINAKAIKTLRGVFTSLPLLALFLTACGGKQEPNQGPPPVRVVVSLAQSETLQEMISAVGTLAANEFVDIESEIDGRIEAIEFDEGQPVKRGQVLARVEESKLRAQAAQAGARLALSEANFARAGSTYEERVISRQEFDQARSQYEADKAAADLTTRLLEDATLRAPFDGIMGARLVSPGQVVQKGVKISSLIDADPIKVEFRVPERHAGALKPGLAVRLTVAAFGDREFSGTTYFVSPAVDPVTRTLLVKARAPNPRRVLQPGMFANLELVAATRPGAVTIPETALMRSGETESVFAVGADSKAALRPVTVGLRLKGKVQILSGIDAGENVVIEGVQKLRPGAAVAFDAQEVK